MHSHGEVMHAHVARAEDGTKIITLAERAAWTDNESAFIHRPAHNTNGEQVKNAVAPAGFVDDSVDTHNTNANTVKNPIAPVAAVDAGTHNTNSNDVKNPDGFAQKDETNDSGVATVVSMVYVTMSPTFSGSIAGYTTASNTLIGTSSTDNAASPSVAASSSSQVVQAANILSSTSAAASSSSQVTAMVGTPLQVTRQSSTAAATPTVAAAAINGNADDVSQSQQSTGMSDGAKAGLAIGIILALALAAGLVFFCWKRNKKDNKEDDINEKSATNEKRSSFFGAGAAPNKRASADSDKSFGTIHTPATAPRLSLRPMTQLLPGFGGEKRKSGNMLATGPAMSEKSSAWERRGQNENPFADGSEKATNPFEEGDGSASAQQSQKNSMEGSEPSTPRSTQSAAAAAGAPRGPNNVHRVQLDFKPSMEDELELKSGQLVRMLHEYDDGWALCVRMDRSQQGVAPRTCLSKTPVKPRGPPPGGRISPQGQMRGPPPQGPNSPRPLTPTSQQSGPVPARKPVPGQAM